MIVIINYKLGNLRSVQKTFERINYQCEITCDLAKIEKADKLILPGVGNFKKGMENLRELDMIDILTRKVIKEKTPILGICLGMQLMTKFSEEGNVDGLGWLDSKVVRFETNDSSRWKIPHMGWNTINMIKDSLIITNDIIESSFYFVHSYYVKCNNRSDILSTTEFNIEFVSTIENGNIFGTQFHPEKSHKQGVLILKNFASL